MLASVSRIGFAAAIAIGILAAQAANAATFALHATSTSLGKLRGELWCR
jgi:hypothetical protein